MKAFVWGLMLLLILAGIQLWPSQNTTWLIVFPTSEIQDNAFRRAALINVSVVEVIDNDSIIIKPRLNMLARELYSHGALIVLSVTGVYGCSPRQKRAWRNTNKIETK